MDQIQSPSHERMDGNNSCQWLTRFSAPFIHSFSTQPELSSDPLIEIHPSPVLVLLLHSTVSQSLACFNYLYVQNHRTTMTTIVPHQTETFLRGKLPFPIISILEHSERKERPKAKDPDTVRFRPDVVSRRPRIQGTKDG